MPKHTFDRGRCKALTIIANSEEKLRTWHCYDGECIVRFLHSLHPDRSQSCLFLLHERTIYRIVLKNDNAFKQGQVTRHFAPPLYFYQRTIFILTQLYILGL